MYVNIFFSLFIEHSQKYWYTLWSLTALPQHGKYLEFNTYSLISHPTDIFRRFYFLPLPLLIFLVTYNSDILHAHWFLLFKFVSLCVFSLIIFLANMSLSSNTSSHSNGKNWRRYLCRVFIYYSNTFVAWSSSSLFLISSMMLSVFHDPIGVFPLIWKKSPTYDSSFASRFGCLFSLLSRSFRSPQGVFFSIFKKLFSWTRFL